MEQLLIDLKQRATEDWLIGYDSRQFFHLCEQFFFTLNQQASKTPLKIVLAEPDPIRFLAGFIAACAADCHIFLCNPNWVEREWQQVFDLVQPDLILGQVATPPLHLPTASPLPLSKSGLIMIPTGGSSGQIRFAVHTWETLTASVRGFYHYFGEKPVHSFCVLPLYHVSGLMQVLRSLITGGQLVIVPFKTLLTDKNYQIDSKKFFISLVPTQLARLLSLNFAAWLSRFHTVLLGGAPAWAELLAQARHHRIPLALTYGMTETASQVVTLKPEAFLAGNNSCGQVLPHAQVTIRNTKGEILPANQTGIVTIEANSLTLGYYPITANSPFQTLQTDDLGCFDQQGYLTLVGRSSHKIITGGENVFPQEVEAVILATQQVQDVCVIGLPDDYWGQVVTAVYVPHSPTISLELLQAAVAPNLSFFKRPKYWIKAETLPRNDQGKVNYEQVKQIASDFFRVGFEEGRRQEAGGRR